MRELDAWEAGWKLVEERKRTRESSLESESSFKPDYNCLTYSPSRPSIGTNSFTLGKLQTGDDGIQALLISEDETLYYRVLLSKTLCTMERDIASLFRRLRPQIPTIQPETWRTTNLTSSMLGTLSKSLGINSSFIKAAQHGTSVITLEPTAKKCKTTEDNLLDENRSVDPMVLAEVEPLSVTSSQAEPSQAPTPPTESSSETTLPAELSIVTTPATDIAPIQRRSNDVSPVNLPSVEVSNTDMTKPLPVDEHHLNDNSLKTPEVTVDVPNSHQLIDKPTGSVLGELCARVDETENHDSDDDLEELDSHSAPNELPESVKTTPLMSPYSQTTTLVDDSSKFLLSRCAMPLFPPARRNWSFSVELPISGGEKITWPPEGWTNFNADQKLLVWEFLAMRLTSPSSIQVPLSRGDLLDKFNFLALPGTQVPPIDTTERKARYYVYETIRKGPSSKEFIKQIKAVAVLRDTSVDHLLDILDKLKVPVRL